MGENSMGMTKRLGEFIVDTSAADIPDEVFEHAKVAFLDWLGVTLAGKDEPLVDKLIRHSDIMGGNSHATILGRGMKKSVSQAALINGSASHALDFDDTMNAFVGHPSVTLFPGILAMSEWQGKSGADFLLSYILGLKTGAAVGISAGPEHYAVGFHATCTVGCLASAAACSKLMGLDKQQTVYALGIGGTQSGGLKRVFGTMCKPFHAGRASEVGVNAALLAQDGFTSADDILEGPSGFFSALKGAVNPQVMDSLGKTWQIETIAQKYHASCHGTHSAIEAAQSIFNGNNLTMDDAKNIRVLTSDVACGAAFRQEANTGLEGKFCISYCLVNAVMRGNTGLQAFSDEMVQDPAAQNAMKKVEVIVDPTMTGMEATVEVDTTGGETFTASSSIFDEIPSLEDKKVKIRAKFIDLATPHLGQGKSEELADMISNLENLDKMETLIQKL